MVEGCSSVSICCLLFDVELESCANDRRVTQEQRMNEDQKFKYNKVAQDDFSSFLSSSSSQHLSRIHLFHKQA